jgi:PST family polysaccharide transporter
MRRAMQFRHLAIIDIALNVTSSTIIIIMAFTGWGYWALVAKPIMMSGLTAVGVWMSCSWVPGAEVVGGREGVQPHHIAAS